MGVGTPLAVGAAAAATEAPGPARTVVLVTGDGAFGFHPAELHAAARAGLRLVCIVGNDGAWGTEMHGQVQAVGRALNTDLGVLRYDLVGVGFGCHGEFVTRRAELTPALQRAFAHEGPSVVNVAIHPAAGAALKTEPLARLIMFDEPSLGLAPTIVLPGGCPSGFALQVPGPGGTVVPWMFVRQNLAALAAQRQDTDAGVPRLTSATSHFRSTSGKDARYATRPDLRRRPPSR